MPPKSSPTPKSGKKKLSKAEKEKLKKEEDDRKRQEEEEAKLKAEREEQDRIDREKREAEERRTLENEERKRRKGQLLELESIWETNCTKLQNEHTERRKNAKWARYMLCDGSPDPTVAREINTYMNLWREDLENIDINTVLRDGKLTLRLINELDFLLEDTPADQLKETEVTRYRETMTELQQLLQEKLDLASHDLLLKATELADNETMNLQRIISEGQIMLCTWGNLSKNPRIKSYEFEEKGFMFELPKVLTLSDCAVRVLFTDYDHYSQHCKTYLPRIKKKVEPEPEEVPEEGEKKEGEEAEGEGEEKTDQDKEEEAVVEEAEVEEPLIEEEEEKEEDDDDFDISDVLAELDNLEKAEEAEEEAQAEEEPTEEAEPLEEDYEIRTPEPEEWEEFDGDEDTIDLRAYSVMGPVFHLDLLLLPPQPKTVSTWVMTTMIDRILIPLEYEAEKDPDDVDPPALTRLDYLVDEKPDGTQSALSNREKEGKEGKEEEEPEKKEKKEERPPIGVSLKLPRDVHFCEEPQVCRWDHASQEWKLDGFSDHHFEEDRKVLHFKTSTFGVMALVQDSHINMPFQSWELRPRGVNHALFTVIAAIVEVEIEIKDDLCMMVVPEDRPELNHFKNVWLPAGDLIKKMKKAGINIFPAVDSHKYVSIQNKNVITEERLYQQMAMTSSCMAYSMSKWNTDVKDENRIVIQGAEHLEDEPLLEEDWALFLITKKRTTKLKMTEFDENFSDDYAEGTEFHADLFHMTLEISSTEGRKRVNETSYKFIDAIHTFLKSTRLLTYS